MSDRFESASAQRQGARRRQPSVAFPTAPVRPSQATMTHNIMLDAFDRQIMEASRPSASRAARSARAMGLTDCHKMWDRLETDLRRDRTQLSRLMDPQVTSSQQRFLPPMTRRSASQLKQSWPPQLEACATSPLQSLPLGSSDDGNREGELRVSRTLTASRSLPNMPSTGRLLADGTLLSPNDDNAAWRHTAFPATASPKLPALAFSFHEALRESPNDAQAPNSLSPSKSRAAVKLSSHAQEMFEVLRLSVGKLGGGKSSGVVSWMRLWDADGNGVLSDAELRRAISDLSGRAGMSGAFSDSSDDTAFRELFRMLDRNGNGKLTLGELMDAIGKVDVKGQVAERVAAVNSRSRRGGGVSVSTCGGRALRKMEDENAFTALDTDGSGQLNTEELVAYYTSQNVPRDDIRALIHTLDADQSGTISQAEWREGLAQFREAKSKVGAELAWMGPMLLQAAIAPIQPPSDETFGDFKPFGKNYRSKLSHGTVARIPREEDRATSMEQVRLIYAHIKRRCAKEQWRSIANSSNELTPLICTMYDVCSYVLKPATYFNRCSFVELLSEDDAAKRPDWFLSHWWGEIMNTLLQCLEQHVKDRKFDKLHTRYWICATALNQWELNQQLTINPANSAFVRALRASGGLLSVVDSAYRSTFGSRLWCNYEACTALEVGDERAHKANGNDGMTGMKYDVYALDAVTKRAIGLTDGLAAVDAGNPGAQAARQLGFPTSVLHAMYTTRVQDGGQTLPSDKVHILNAVVGSADLECTPEVNHERYHELNMKLLNRVVHLAMGTALAQGADERTRLFKVIARSALTELCWQSLHGTDALPAYVNESLMVELFEAIPESLTLLKLVYPLPSLPAQLTSYANLRCAHILA